MKREVEREEKLPAFDLQVSELELLWERVVELFESDKPIRSSIKLTLPNEKLQFDDLSELKSYGRVRGRVTQFRIEFSQGDRTISIKTGGVLFQPTPTVRVEAETDVWCAGAINTVQGVIQHNRMWYWWFVNLPFTFLFFVLSVAPVVGSWIGPTKVGAVPPKVALAWFSVVVLLGFLSFTKEKLLPAASITFSHELNFVRRYGAEISLVLGVISIVLAIVALV